MSDGRLSLGRSGEEVARRYLERRGYRILDSNFRALRAEIDLVAEEGGTVVFVEVKTRSGSGFGHPFEAVTAAKRRQLGRAAAAYLAAREWHERPARFDVVAVHFDADREPSVELLTNAFELDNGA